MLTAMQLAELTLITLTILALVALVHSQIPLFLMVLVGARALLHYNENKR